MLSVFSQHKIIIGLILLLFFISIVLQILVARYFSLLIRETENMASTHRELLIQCKKKFTNCYKLNNGVLNVPVFVDKFMNKITMGKFSIYRIKNLSGQIMLLSVFVSGVGACRGIAIGETFGEILPYYIISLFGLYIYFSVSGLMDITGKRRVLKINLIDYLENNMINKLMLLEDDMKLVESKDNMEKPEPVREERKRPIFVRNEEKELEELLKEFLT